MELEKLHQQLKSLNLGHSAETASTNTKTEYNQEVNENILQFPSATYKFLNSTQTVTIIDKYWEKGRLFYIVETKQGTPIRGVHPIRLSNIIPPTKPNAPIIQSINMTENDRHAPENFAADTYKSYEYQPDDDEFFNPSPSHSSTQYTSTPKVYNNNNIYPKHHQSPTDLSRLSIYEYKLRANPEVTIRINVGWLSDKGKKMSVKCENKEDIKQYYSTLRARLSPLGIPLKSWSNIQPGQSLCELTEENCINYKNAIQQI